MNFEHELETLRENMDAMGKGIQQAFADLLSAIALNNLEELDRIQKNDRKINEIRYANHLPAPAAAWSEAAGILLQSYAPSH